MPLTAGRLAAVLRSRPRGKHLLTRHAVVLGIVQGPAELLPISSSGHVVLAPAILGWPYERLDPADRKAFEVALHAGTAVGLTAALRDEVAVVARSLDVDRVLRGGLATVPAVCAGLLLHTPIVERMSTPRRVALSQLVAGAILLLADRRPADRDREDAGAVDALAVGLAQAAALAPGVSRGGAALTALRLRRLDRRSASELSRHAAAPILMGATTLEAIRLCARRPTAEALLPLAVGAAAACASTVAARGLVAAMDRAASYLPLAVYRMALGAFGLWRLRPGRRPRRALEWRP